MKLLVDFGNTRLKWASVVADAPLRPGGVFAHADVPLVAELRREWGGLARVDSAWIASVVSSAREDELAAFVRDRFGVPARFVRSPAAALGIRNAYAQPERLGVDRFLALAAAHARHPRLQVLVSAGTALTIDALDADGSHLGGLIVASPHAMRLAVVAGTARVDARGGRLSERPRATADAVVTGSLYAAAGAIERFRASLVGAGEALPPILLGGGGADELEPLLAPVERVHDLVLHGLALWARDAATAAASPDG
ncbi:MAG TPA: type III pantothenate kinase [Dokdonella sp.]|nr:type III pantothenate kinase [Dokdonella sp.]